MLYPSRFKYTTAPMRHAEGLADHAIDAALGVCLFSPAAGLVRLLGPARARRRPLGRGDRGMPMS